MVIISYPLNSYPILFILFYSEIGYCCICSQFLGEIVECTFNKTVDG